MSKFFNSIKRKYLFYLLAIFLGVFISFYSITLKVEPKDENKFGILIEGFEINMTIDDINCSNKIYKKNVYNVNSNGLGIFISAQSETSDFDLLFVTETSFMNNSYVHSLVELNVDNILSVFPEFKGDYLIKDNNIYGFNITESIKKYCSNEIENKYYVCFFKNSFHSGVFNNKTSSESIEYLNELLELNIEQ